jgi:hypothetical protein
MAADPSDTNADREVNGNGNEEEWQFSLADIENRNDGSDGDDGDDGDDENQERTAEGGGGNVAGSFTPAEGIEAGDIDVENALFVLVGAVLAVLVVAGFATILP